MFSKKGSPSACEEDTIMMCASSESDDDNIITTISSISKTIESINLVNDIAKKDATEIRAER